MRQSAVALLLVTAAMVVFGETSPRNSPSQKPARAAPSTAAKNVRAIRKALARRLDIHFVDTSLTDAVKILQDSLQVPIVLEKDWLEAENIDPNLPINFKLSDITGHSALNHLLRASGAKLGWTIQNEMLRITTREMTLQSYSTGVYDLTFAKSVKPIEPECPPREQGIIDILIRHTGGDQIGHWLELRGEGGRLGLLSGARKSLLVVRQTEAVHVEVARLLADLQAAIATDDSCDSPSQKPVDDFPAIPLRREREETIRRVLDRPIDLDLDEVSVIDAVGILADMLKVNVFLDHAGLKTAMGDATPPISLSVRGISGRAVLDEMLEPLGLYWTIIDESLLVTEAAKALSHYEARVYDVRGFEPWAVGEILMNTTGGPPDGAWYGFDGEAISVQTVSPHWLVIYQTEHVHHEIRELLAILLRREGEASPEIDKP